MKLLAITSFPPSVRGSNSFGYHAVSRFLELPGVTKIIVIADILTDDLKKNIHEEILVDERLTIDRQWQYNSIKNLFQIIRATISYNPDIVWVNLQYTSFGSNLITAFLGLCIPGTLRLLGYSVIVLLHNFLGGTDLDKMSFSYSGIVRKLTLYVDKIAMRSIMSSNKVFTMVEGYQKELSYAYPNTDVEYVRQDLFAVPEYKPANKTSLKILTLGYFGTYKKLDILLNAFLLVRRDLPNTSLTIAGSNNSHAPGYLEKLQEEHIGKEKNVEFSGYVAENELANLFWGSNIVVITNSAAAGDSGVIELAHVYGRAILVPKQIWNCEGLTSECGVVLYDLHQPDELAKKLIELLNNPMEQNKLGEQGYNYTLSRRGSFTNAHLRAFTRLASKGRIGNLRGARVRVLREDR